MATRTETALNWLLDQVTTNNAEFPDACSQAARMYRVSYDKLRDAYDAECERRSHRFANWAPALPGFED